MVVVMVQLFYKRTTRRVRDFFSKDRVLYETEDSTNVKYDRVPYLKVSAVDSTVTSCRLRN